MKLTDYKIEMVYHLINHLYSWGGNLTLTTSLTLKGMIDVTGPAIVRRIDEMCQVIEL